jgi:hypothetical protein
VGSQLDPSRYSTVSAYELLSAASRGLIGLDLRLLHALVDDPVKSLPDLLRFAMEQREGDQVLLEEDLIAVFRHLKSPESLPFFVNLVRRQPHDVSDEVAEAFALFPEPSARLLLGLYDELGDEQGAEVAFLLASLRVRDQRVLDLLLRRLKFDQSDASFCLGLYGDPAAKPHLESLLADLESRDPDDQWACRGVRAAIQEIDLPAPQVEHPDFDIWDLYPETAPPQFSILAEPERVAMLSSQSAEYRSAAAESFYNEELSEAARAALLETARHDPEAPVRARAWEALGSVVDRPEIKEAIAARLADTGAPLEERCGAMVGLASEAGDPAVRRWILEFYALPEARVKALEAMHRSDDRRFAPYFPPHLEDPDLEIRRRAIWGVGHLGIHTEVGRLRSFFNDEEFREDAIFAYALAVPATLSRGRARALLRKVETDAGGLSAVEAELVQWAIDERLARLSLDPVFTRGATEAPAEIPVEPPSKVGRNDPCPCGSGKKFKKCCGA